MYVRLTPVNAISIGLKFKLYLLYNDYETSYVT